MHLLPQFLNEFALLLNVLAYHLPKVLWLLLANSLIGGLRNFLALGINLTAGRS